MLRVKVATIVVAVAMFVASLIGIAVYNPAVGNRAAAPAQAQPITIIKPGGSQSLLLAPPPRVQAMQPLVRSRGS